MGRGMGSELAETYWRAEIAVFSEFAEHLEYVGLGKDDMLQEGFKEVVEKNESALRVVGKLDRLTYNECAVEEGVVVLRTTPRYWGTNVRQAGKGLIDLL